MATATATASAAIAFISKICARQREIRQYSLLKMYFLCALLVLQTSSFVFVEAAAVPLGDLLSPTAFKPLCSPQHEHFIESDGKESSLIIELKPGIYGAKHSSCTRILSAPPSYGFIVRLILPKLLHAQHTDNASNSPVTALGAASNMPALVSEMMPQLQPAGMLNATAAAASALLVGRSCPLNIFSSTDPHTAQWRVDPCQLEDTASEMEDPVRLFHGRVRIVWEHGQHTLKSKLMVTVLGKGEQCKDTNKHQCLKIGDEPILCISKELSCDGIRHCPYSNEYDSDEDYELCYKQRRPGPGTLPKALESDLFEQFTLDVLLNLFSYDSPKTSEEGRNNDSAAGVVESAAGVNNSTTQLHKVHTKDMKKPGGGFGSAGSLNAIGTMPQPELDGKAQDNATAENGNANAGTGGGGGSGFTRRNSTRSGLHSDLSKYGPWGYLMLGMLLCGGALLICGLWASASQHAANNEREAALAAANGAGIDASGATSPPNYEELDPPPAYSVLFPNQKASSSNTLNALDGAVASTAAAAAAAAAAAEATTTTTTTGTTATATATATATEQPQQQQPQQTGDEPTTN